MLNRTSLLLIFILATGVAPVFGQAPGVPIYNTNVNARDENPENNAILAKLEELRKSGKLLDIPTVMAQRSKKTCELVLPKPRTKPLTPREVWKTARASYLRIGHYYLCNTCAKWHLSLAGGYVIADGGIAATADHVIRPTPNMKEAYLVVVDDDGNVYPTLEILASNISTDVAVIRTGATKMPPLPLSRDVQPGDSAYLFSDPMGNRGYFSAGIVNRFVREMYNGKEGRVVVDVSTDWTPGSSGSAVLDDRGNVIGHVSTIDVLGNRVSQVPPPNAEGQKPTQVPPGNAEKPTQVPPSNPEPPKPGPVPRSYMSVHHAARAGDLLDVIKTK